MCQMRLPLDAMQFTSPDFPISTMPYNDRPTVTRGLTILVLITAMHAGMVFALSSVHTISQESTGGVRLMESVFVMEMKGSAQPASGASSGPSSGASSENNMSQHKADSAATPSLLTTSAQGTDAVDARLAKMEPTPARTEKKSTINTSAVGQTNHAAQRSISNNSSSNPAAMAGSLGGKDEVTPPNASAAYLNNPHPPYPRISRRLREEGQVLLAVEIDVDGHASQAVIKRSSGFDRLDQSALQTVWKWRFMPGKQAGIAKKMWVNIPINFVLD